MPRSFVQLSVKNPYTGGTKCKHLSSEQGVKAVTFLLGGFAQKYSYSVGSLLRVFCWDFSKAVPKISPGLDIFSKRGIFPILFSNRQLPNTK